MVTNYFEYYTNHYTNCNTNCNSNIHIYMLPIKYEYLEDGTMVAFPKILWIKIIQRRWKKIMAERKKIINERTSTKEIIYYQSCSKWSSGNNYLPSLTNMML